MSHAAGRHLLQFYEDPASLAERVGAYLAEGARRGEHLIVIARRSRWSAFAARLEREDVDPRALRNDGRLLELDAEETLAGLLMLGRPDAARFEDLVASRVREAVARAAGAGVRAYGEMVDLLWEAGRGEAAAELEELWNGLLRRAPFGLLCAYAVDALAPGRSTGAIHSVLAAHGRLQPLEAEGSLARALDATMREALGAEAVEALTPLIRATQHAQAVEPGPEATLLWLRRHFPELAAKGLALARSGRDAAVP